MLDMNNVLEVNKAEYYAILKVMAHMAEDRKVAHKFMDEIRTLGHLIELESDQFYEIVGFDLYEKEPDENDKDFDYGVPMGAKDYGSDFDFCQAVEITKGFYD